MTKAIMTFEIGKLTLGAAAPMRFAAAVFPVDRRAAAGPVSVVDRSDVITASPPPEAQAAVDAAWARAAQLASENRELHFTHDKASGRVIIEVCTLDGEVLRTIPPARALDVMSGGAL
jgi:flagellar protein FlaG